MAMSCSTRGRVVAYLQRAARLSDRLQGLLDPVGQHHRARKRGASRRWRLGTAGLPLEHLRTGVRYDEQLKRDGTSRGAAQSPGGYGSRWR